MILKKISHSSTLKEVLLKLLEDEIRSMVYDGIFLRGKNYYESGYVVALEQIEQNLVHAKVKGNHSSPYKIELSLEDHALMGQCNCQYGDICKHIVAVLLKIDNEKQIKESITLAKQADLQNHLATLSKEKLIELVIAYAPESFKQEIIFKDAPKEEQKVRINEIVSQIQSDLNDEELLYEPEGFQNKLFSHLEQLKSLLNQDPEHLFEVIFDLVDEIESKEEEGYLYNDYHDSEESFDFNRLVLKVVALIGHIKDSTKQVEVLMQFATQCRDSNHLVMDYEAITIEDKSLLLPYFNAKSDLNFYSILPLKS